MLGYGSTLPVLPYYIERLALEAGGTIVEASAQVGLITGIFALMQFFFAPLWGKFSDHFGRKPVFLIGLGGYSVSMIFFAIGTNLIMLYAARIVGGVLSAAVLPVAGAYVSDATSEKTRSHGMTWLGSATGLGVVFGPVMGAFLSQTDLHFTYQFNHFKIDGFSIPFFAAALFSLLSLGAAIKWLPEPCNPSGMLLHPKQIKTGNDSTQKSDHRYIFIRIRTLLVLALISQFALSIFEGTFALHAKYETKFGPSDMGWVFMVCGLVMAGAQALIVDKLIRSFGEQKLLTIGFMIMGVALTMLMTTRNISLILLYVGVFALGVALISPSLATLVSKSAKDHTGAALGQLSAANNLGLAIGPITGGLMISLNLHLPYLFTAILLITTTVYLGRAKPN